MMIKNDLVDSVCEISENSLLLQAAKDLLVATNCQVVRRVTVSSGFNLERSLLLPDFDVELFPFLVDYGSTADDGHSVKKSYSFNLVNVQTGHVDVLIKGSA